MGDTAEAQLSNDVISDNSGKYLGGAGLFAYNDVAVTGTTVSGSVRPMTRQPMTANSAGWFSKRWTGRAR